MDLDLSGAGWPLQARPDRMMDGVLWNVPGTGPTLEERNVVPSSLPIAHEDIVRLMRDCLDRLRSKEELIAELNQHRMSLVAELESARREVAKLRAELVMNTQAFIDLLEKAAQQ